MDVQSDKRLPLPERLGFTCKSNKKTSEWNIAGQVIAETPGNQVLGHPWNIKMGRGVVGKDRLIDIFSVHREANIDPSGDG